MLPSDHCTLDPQRSVLRGWPHVLLESCVSVSNGYLQSTGRFAGPHRPRPVHTRLKLREVCKNSGSPDAEHQTIRCSPDSNPERFAKPRGHRTQNIGRFNLRPVPGVRCLTLAEPGSLYTGCTGTASGASGPASGSEKHSRDFSKISHQRNRKYT